MSVYRMCESVNICCKWKALYQQVDKTPPGMGGGSHYIGHSCKTIKPGKLAHSVTLDHAIIKEMAQSRSVTLPRVDKHEAI